MKRFSWNSLNNFFVMAPMAGITDSPFRQVVKKWGADVVFSEMVSADAIFYGSEKTVSMLNFLMTERPFIVQIFGSDELKMAYAANWITKNIKPNGIDINMGCPAKKIVRDGKGSALLKDLESAGKIVKAVRENTTLPLSLKLRLGWQEVEIEEFLKSVSDLGVDIVTVHARTAQQGFKGKADWETLGRLIKVSPMPVIANGDILKPDDTKTIFGMKAKGIMIGRGALGNPWIFKSLKEGKEYVPGLAEIKETILWHTEMNIEEYGEAKGIIEMRKHFGWYLTGLEDIKKLRISLMQCCTLEQVKDLLK